jgi:phage shock protein PspC (stress-responsive transcriptional regulator)
VAARTAVSGTLQAKMFIFGFDQATGQTLALLATFGGIGVFVNILIGYIIAQVLAERRENREFRERGEV